MAATPPTASTSSGNKHAVTALERQRAQVARLLKDPAKPAFIPAPPKEKTVRPPREMMKNVQGSSAGAGSGEFHVYKANRRREYERLKIMEEATRKETDTAEFERKRKEREEQADAKTAKNRARRMKKKERKGKGAEDEEEGVKRRRLAGGAELVLRPAAPADDAGAEPARAEEERAGETVAAVEGKVTIHDHE